MATEGVVVSNANDATPAIGGLFAGKSFFLTQRIPMRSHYLDLVKANGGRVVRLEQQADYIIADHLRRDCPPTSLSYSFLDAAIRDGALPNPDDHRAGPAGGAVRAVGSTAVPAKATRTQYTAQDDRDLWNWVQRSARTGVAVKGLELYKQLEAVNPRHTYQSWRDRYLKKLVYNPPQGEDVDPRAIPQPTQTIARPPPPTNGARAGAERKDQQGEEESGGEPEGQSDEEEEEEEEEGEGAETHVKTNTDFGFLWENVEDIMCCNEDDYEHMWGVLESRESHKTAYEWKRLYEDKVLPKYLAKQKKEQAIASPSKRQARPTTPERPILPAELTTPEMVAMKAKAAREKAEQEKAAMASAQKRKRPASTSQNNTPRQKRSRPDQIENSTQGQAEQVHAHVENETSLNNNGLQLTEQNLASQQAEHKTAQRVRGTDLPEDDDNVDQSGYAEYLHGLVGAHPGGKTDQPIQAASAEVPDRLMDTPEEEGRDAIELDPENEKDEKEDEDAFISQKDGLDAGEINIDLTLAEPEGGFTFSSQEQQTRHATTGGETNGELPLPTNGDNAEDEGLEEGPAKALPAGNQALDTQNIFDQETQKLDLSLPLPSESDPDESEPELPDDPGNTQPPPRQQPAPKATAPSRPNPPPKAKAPARTSTTSKPKPRTSTGPQPPPQTETIPAFITRLTAKGHNPTSLHSALYRTSAQLQAAELLAMSEKLGLPVPGNIPAIWSPEDDAKVGSTDATVLRALCDRKGFEEYEFRARFLEDWRAGR